MPETIKERFRNAKEPVAWITGIGVLLSGAGISFTGYLGLPGKVESLQQDNRALVCMVAQLQEGKDPSFCSLFLSSDTRILFEGIRGDSRIPPTSPSLPPELIVPDE